MSELEKKIIAIGGGGFTHQSDAALDDFVINQIEKKNKKIGFLGTASKDDKTKIDLFYKRFENKNLELSHFNLTSRDVGFSQWLFDKDIIYIGGGNTAYMLELWEKNNLVSLFKEAYEKGIILSGVSAGGVCWFDWIFSDSLGPGYKALKGINLISGSCTPHSLESNRMSQYQLEIKNSKLPPGVAIDDGVAVLFVNGIAREVCSTRENCDAYFIDKINKISLKEYIK